MGNIVYVIIGLLLLLEGRNLFWLFIGIMGFFAGLNFAGKYFASRGGIELVIVAVALGLLGALLALGYQWIAVILAGFLGGGYLLANLLSFIGVTNASAQLVFIIGGIAGMITMILIFNFALIALTSLVGALLIVQELNVSYPLQLIIFVCLAAAGVILQSLINGD